jgi:hypothetical protein
MSKPARKPREIRRASDTKPERITSRIVASRPDLRQAGLFDQEMRGQTHTRRAAFIALPLRRAVERYQSAYAFSKSPSRTS